MLCSSALTSFTKRATSINFSTSESPAVRLPPSQIKSLCPYALLFRRAPASYKRDFHDRVFHKFAQPCGLGVHRGEVISHLVHKPPQTEECYLLPCRRRHKTHPRRFWTGGNAFSYIARKSGTGENCGGRRANVNARVRRYVVHKRSGAEDEGRWCEADVRRRRLF